MERFLPVKQTKTRRLLLGASNAGGHDEYFSCVRRDYCFVISRNPIGSEILFSARDQMSPNFFGLPVRNENQGARRRRTAENTWLECSSPRKRGIATACAGFDQGVLGDGDQPVRFESIRTTPALVTKV